MSYIVWLDLGYQILLEFKLTSLSMLGSRAGKVDPMVSVELDTYYHYSVRRGS